MNAMRSLLVMLLPLLFGVALALHPFDSVGGPLAPQCTSGLDKHVVLEADKTIGHVQTTDPFYFKRALLNFGKSFAGWKTKAYNFFLKRYGMNFTGAPINPLAVNGSYGYPYKTIPEASLYLFTFNSLLNQDQRISSAQGIFGAQLMENAIPNCATGRFYLFEIIFNSTYLSTHHIGGSFGLEVGYWDPSWLSTYYGFTIWEWEYAPGRIANKTMTTCGVLPSYSDLKYFPSIVEITNRPLYYDPEYGVGDGTIHEFQKPGFVFTASDPIDYRFFNTIAFPTKFYRDYNVQDDSCLPTTLPFATLHKRRSTHPYHPLEAAVAENYNNYMRIMNRNA